MFEFLWNAPNNLKRGAVRRENTRLKGVIKEQREYIKLLKLRIAILAEKERKFCERIDHEQSDSS
jgi:hypothetical protein